VASYRGSGINTLRTKKLLTRIWGFPHQIHGLQPRTRRVLLEWQRANHTQDTPGPVGGISGCEFILHLFERRQAIELRSYTADYLQRYKSTCHENGGDTDLVVNALPLSSTVSRDQSEPGVGPLRWCQFHSGSQLDGGFRSHAAIGGSRQAYLWE